MVRIDELKWGSYQNFEGPYWLGKDKPFKLPQNPNDNTKVVAVIAATEGSSYSAINAYDRCIISIGLIQFCAANYFLAENLLGDIASKNPLLMTPLKPALDLSKSEFKVNDKGRWRFFFKDGRGEVDTIGKQQQLYLLRSTGKKGSWDEESKVYTKTWVTSLADLLGQEGAQSIQCGHVAARVKSFAMPNARKVLFEDPAPSTGWTGAMRAAFLSFAANLPAVAGKHLDVALATAPGSKWSKDWCLHILKELTFGPKIAIYPNRYNKIRPVLESLYGVDLPDFAEELQSHQSLFDSQAKPMTLEPKFDTVEDIQKVLELAGFDIGPRSSDGKMGPKTINSLKAFQFKYGLVVDGIIGPKTRAKFLEVYRTLR